ncbi:hypothetical protein BC832DRAFT_553718 [Gaertneriomyces semiglobifer]|nr:hypothetical protein BC832DRAFT_553718 [Gaertneriomyces semiglobifer]
MAGDKQEVTVAWAVTELRRFVAANIMTKPPLPASDGPQDAAMQNSNPPRVPTHLLQQPPVLPHYETRHGPGAALHNDKMRQLHNEMISVAATMAPRRQEMELRTWIIKQTRSCLRKYCESMRWGKHRAHLVGSQALGVYFPTSGIDLMVTAGTPNVPLRQFLQGFAAYLKSGLDADAANVVVATSVSFYEGTPDVVAFTTRLGQIRVQIFGQYPRALWAVEWSRTQLQLFSPWFYPLLMLLRLWFHNNKFDDVKNGGASGHVMFLIVVYTFLKRVAERSGQQNLPSAADTAVPQILANWLYPLFYDISYEFRTQSHTTSDKWKRFGTGLKGTFLVRDPSDPTNNTAEYMHRLDAAREVASDSIGALTIRLEPGYAQAQKGMLTGIVEIDPALEKLRSNRCSEWDQYVRTNPEAIKDLNKDDETLDISAECGEAEPMDIDEDISTALIDNPDAADQPAVPSVPNALTLTPSNEPKNRDKVKFSMGKALPAVQAKRSSDPLQDPGVADTTFPNLPTAETRAAASADNALPAAEEFITIISDDDDEEDMDIDDETPSPSLYGDDVHNQRHSTTGQIQTQSQPPCIGRATESSTALNVPRLSDLRTARMQVGPNSLLPVGQPTSQSDIVVIANGRPSTQTLHAPRINSGSPQLPTAQVGSIGTQRVSAVTPVEQTSNRVGVVSKTAAITRSIGPSHVQAGVTPATQQQQTTTSKVRIWTHQNGRAKIEAELLDVVKGQVHLRKANRERITIPLSTLDSKDIDFVTSTIVDRVIAQHPPPPLRQYPASLKPLISGQNKQDGTQVLPAQASDLDILTLAQGRPSRQAISASAEAGANRGHSSSHPSGDVSAAYVDTNVIDLTSPESSPVRQEATGEVHRHAGAGHALTLIGRDENRRSTLSSTIIPRGRSPFRNVYDGTHRRPPYP